MKFIDWLLQEDVIPANNVGQGNIKGVGVPDPNDIAVKRIPPIVRRQKSLKENIKCGKSR